MRRLSEEETTATLITYGLDRPRGSGFAFHDLARNTSYDWHAHDYHQLIYALAGTTQIESERARYLLPTGRAGWIPAGVRHRTLMSDIEGASIYFAPDTVKDGTSRVRILVATPVMREMILHALRWPLGASEADPVAASFFRTLALMSEEWLESELPLSLPGAMHPGIVRAMDYALGNPGAATQAGALSAAGLSERTFRRLFLRETGMGWQAWLGQARVMAAMALLTEGRLVTDVALEVGYASLSAFAKAFSQLIGEAPAAFRRRAARR
ncbi:AraC family transcriptional regulator [Sphingomonas solaris]|uniref:AraC family transcriptional regulator n=1 Tax=Alterirhizorhabdus solaris TaxID=2529389 RepID=A0A558QS73_9SPHN|nr:helix-turn-helix transcriptional regulator [Sphingomonas solaris]TVV69897.1 AraC family transcriptional regulator [Sphingomonas solaris]